VRYEEVFSFRTLPGLSRDSVHHSSSNDSSFGRVPRTFVPSKPKEFAAGVRFSANELLAAQRRTLAEIAKAATPHDSSGAPAAMLCVTVRRDTTAVPADAGTIQGLKSLGFQAVSASDCQGPHVRLIVEKVEGWAQDVLRVEATVAQARSGTRSVCVVIREERRWSTTCRLVYAYVSSH
jgi:hypothetical protein